MNKKESLRKFKLAFGAMGLVVSSIANSTELPSNNDCNDLLNTPVCDIIADCKEMTMADI
ncbi:MAG: hypothetical protein HQK50_08515 [Oligoflexia bacterium]|nr:hypothetical protein [Oligoflexia bacterium]